LSGARLRRAKCATGVWATRGTAVLADVIALGWGVGTGGKRVGESARRQTSTAEFMVHACGAAARAMARNETPASMANGRLNCGRRRVLPATAASGQGALSSTASSLFPCPRARSCPFLLAPALDGRWVPTCARRACPPKCPLSSPTCPRSCARTWQGLSAHPLHRA
jgi:hypothetical protein